MSRKAPLVLCALVLFLTVSGSALAKGPQFEIVDGGSGTWVSVYNQGLLRLDAEQGRVAGRVRGDRPEHVAAGLGRVWALRGRQLIRIDPETDEIEKAARVGVRWPSDLAVGEESIWIVGGLPDARARAVLLRLDPETLEVQGRFHLGRRAAPQISISGGAVWLAFPRRTRRSWAGLVAIDERSGTLRYRRHLQGSTLGLVGSDDGLWVLLQREGARRSRLMLLDPASGTRARAFPGPPAPLAGLAVGKDVLWAASICSLPDCNVSEARVLAYDPVDGGPITKPFALAASRSTTAPFLGGIGAVGHDSAAVASTNGDGDSFIAIFDPTEGLIRSVPLGTP